MDDPVLNGMAEEFKTTLIRTGVDPSMPPPADIPPSQPSSRAFEEYKRRGGVVYDDPEKLVLDLIERVKEISA